jgi:predicted NBD/HSP70 family sugar kinase
MMCVFVPPTSIPISIDPRNFYIKLQVSCDARVSLRLTGVNPPAEDRIPRGIPWSERFEGGHVRGHTTPVTVAAVGEINRTAIREALRSRGPLSRRAIGELTGLSVATVNRLTADLLADGLIAADGFEASTGGRRSTLLRYAGEMRATIAVQVRLGGAVAALVDLDGRVRHRESAAFDDSDSLDDGVPHSLTQTVELISRLLDVSDELGVRCVAVGVTVPGVVHPTNGTIDSIPELGWPPLALAERLSAHVGLPVIVENDANALAYGELHRGGGRGLDSLVAILLDNGLGAGIIANGALHRGRRSEAGEVAYLLTDRAALARPVSAQGDLEDRIGAEALTREARSRGMGVAEDERISAHRVFELAQDGDAIATAMAGEILDMLAMTVAATVAVLDPELVVIGSALASDAELILPALNDRLAGRLMSPPRLEIAALGVDGVLLGIAELAAAAVRQDKFVVG